MNERYELDPRGDVTDNLRSEYRLLKTEFARQSKTAKARTIKASVLWCAFGAALGMTGMVYWYERQPTPQPVAVEIERLIPGDTAGLEAQIKALSAKIDAHYTQQMQRQKEVRFKTDKLELTKQVHDAQLVTAQEGADHIRKIAAELGVSRMVVK